MRPASSVETPPRSRSRTWAVVVVSVAAVAVITIVGFVLLGGGGSPVPPRGSGIPGSPSSPPQSAFVLPVTETSTVALRRRNAEATRQAVTAIQTTLSGFYDAAFMDPQAWREGIPTDAWNAFAAPLQKQAKSDADALTLGESAADMEELSVTNASLSVRLLIDTRGRPVAAFATVVLDATGALAGGQSVLVLNRATFLLRPSEGRWLVMGYPNVATNVESPPSPSPGATATPTPTASGSPSPGASP